MRKYHLLFFLFILLLPFGSYLYAKTKVVIYPAPKSELQSSIYSVYVNKQKVAVYNAKIGAADDKLRFKAVDDLLHSADFFDTAAFSYFDIEGTATITVGVKDLVTTAKVLPASANIVPHYCGRWVTFFVKKAANLTVEINGEWVKSLHIFVNPIQENIPKPNDPNVLFIGPGIHEISNLNIGDNKSIYVAGGAILKAVIGKDERFGIEPSGLKNYAPRIFLHGHHIKIFGRGIIDAGNAPVHAGNFITLQGDDITVEGVIIRNSCGWTVPLRQCTNVEINNIKILGYRANSDGIDVCNSKNVVIENSFIRTNDDLIVIKTEQNEGPANNIIVKNCVLWNQLAHALSVGAELREQVSNVLFDNCDIIHDQGREWALRIFQSDSTTISHIVFHNIRIEDSHNLISLWVGKMASTLQDGEGTIKDVHFDNIIANGYPLSIVLTAAKEGSLIREVSFNHVLLNNKPLTEASIIKNGVVEFVSIRN